MSFESIAYVRRALNKFIDEQMQPGDLVAVIRTAGGAGTLQQFTADKRQLHTAIDRAKYVLMGRADTGAFKAITPPPLKIPYEQDARLQTVENFRDEVYSVGTLGALNYVVRGLRDMPGRKSILLLSDDL
jgi:VWFA-related protein